jgi:hypothetical protein
VENKQIQKAGDNAQQFQDSNITIINGIDETRAREICQEISALTVKNYTDEARNIANARITAFENKLLPKMEVVEGALQSFSDPSFQLLLIEAQKTAAATERKEDYDLLSELLIHRFQKGENRKIRASISRAVKIIDEISDDALLGLTVFYSIMRFSPAKGDISQGLNDLNDLFEKVIYNQLPLGIEWLEHLDFLDIIRISSFDNFKKIKQYYSEKLDGYISVGIEKSGENYLKAIEILNKVGLPDDILVDHALNSDYVRINVPAKDQIDSIILQQININGQIEHKKILLSGIQKNAIESVYDLYKLDDNIKDNNIEQFMIEWNKRPNLKKLQEWWDNIPQSFDITMVGRVLAHANVQRCDKRLPPLN